MRGDVAAQRERRVEVDLQDLGKVGVGEGLGGVAPLDAGAVDKQANLVAVGEDGGDQGGDRGRVREVGGVDGGVAAQGADGVEGGLVGGIALVFFWGGEGCSLVGEWEGKGGGGVNNTCTRSKSAPASARAMAMAWPMPRVPPVRRAVWPSREKRLLVVVAAMVGRLLWSFVFVFPPPQSLTHLLDVGVFGCEAILRRGSVCERAGTKVVILRELCILHTMKDHVLQWLLDSLVTTYSIGLRCRRVSSIGTSSKSRETRQQLQFPATRASFGEDCPSPGPTAPSRAPRRGMLGEYMSAGARITGVGWALTEPQVTSWVFGV